MLHKLLNFSNTFDMATDEQSDATTTPAATKRYKTHSMLHTHCTQVAAVLAAINAPPHSNTCAGTMTTDKTYSNMSKSNPDPAQAAAVACCRCNHVHKHSRHAPTPRDERINVIACTHAAL